MADGREPRRSLDEYADEEMLTLKDVMRLANVSRYVMRKALRSGELIFSRLGDRTDRVAAGNVRRWIASRQSVRVLPLVRPRKRA
jgi:hypothetical protein